MANSRSTRNSPLVALMLILAGVLLLIEVLLSYVDKSMSSSWLFFLAYAALTIAFVLLFLWRSVDIIGRVAFIVAAVGWAILALASVVSGMSSLVILGVILALIGSVVAGIIVFARRLFGREASTVFLITMIVAAIELLNVWHPFLSGVIASIVAVVFGVLLVISGVLARRRR